MSEPAADEQLWISPDAYRKLTRLLNSLPHVPDTPGPHEQNKIDELRIERDAAQERAARAETSVDRLTRENNDLRIRLSTDVPDEDIIKDRLQDAGLMNDRLRESLAAQATEITKVQDERDAAELRADLAERTVLDQAIQLTGWRASAREESDL